MVCCSVKVISVKHRPAKVDSLAWCCGIHVLFVLIPVWIITIDLHIIKRLEKLAVGQESSQDPSWIIESWTSEVRSTKCDILSSAYCEHSVTENPFGCHCGWILAIGHHDIYIIKVKLKGESWILENDHWSSASSKFTDAQSNDTNSDTPISSSSLVLPCDWLENTPGCWLAGKVLRDSDQEPELCTSTGFVIFQRIHRTDS